MHSEPNLLQEMETRNHLGETSGSRIKTGGFSSSRLPGPTGRLGSTEDEVMPSQDSLEKLNQTGQ